MRKKAWFFKNRTALGILGVTLVFGILATGCPTGSEPEPATYTVTFDTDGGSPAPSQQTVKEGGKVSKPTDPTKSGSVFDGWYNGNTAWDFATSTVTQAITLTAHWKADSATYTATFDANGGSPAPAQQTVSSGGKLTRPASDPTKVDYTFAGWYKESSFVNVWNFDTDTVTAPTTVYAKWVWGIAYTVTFNVDGGSVVPDQTVSSGGTVTSPTPEPTKADYTFDGWYRDAAKTTLWNFDTDTVTANTTVYAKWVSGTVQSYTVTFDADGGYPTPNSQTVSSGGKVTRPTSDPYKSSYTFVNWYTDAAKTTLWNFAVDTVTANTTIYAKWVSGYAQSYTVSFDTDGGSTVSSQTVVSGEKAQTPASPTKADYTFAGWYKESSFVNVWNFAVDVVTTYTTIYAKWIAGTVESFEVSFDADGGSPAPASQTVVSGEKALEPANPTKEGYTFDGWHADAAKTTLWDFATDTVTAATTIYAKWLAQYTVTFDADGGSPATQTVAVNDGDSISSTSAITNVSYNYVSGGDWILQSDGRRQSPAISSGITKSRISFTSTRANASITIQLDVSSYSYNYAFISQLDNASATYNSGYFSDSRISDEQSVSISIPVPTVGDHFIDVGYYKYYTYAYGSDCAWYEVASDVANPTRDNYTFGGWYTAQNGGGSQFTADTTVSANTTVYARWLLSGSITINLRPTSNPSLSNITTSVNGEAPQFSVGSGSSPQWYWDGKLITGANSSAYTLENSLRTQGVHELSVVVTSGTERLSARCRVTINGN
jgi:uncharacterized repeat protein (TIGR02543 family)